MKTYRAAVKLLIRISDLPFHILFFRLYPAIFVTSALCTVIVMYTIYFFQNVSIWAEDFMDRVQSFITLY